MTPSPPHPSSPNSILNEARYSFIIVVLLRHSMSEVEEEWCERYVKSKYRDWLKGGPQVA